MVHHRRSSSCTIETRVIDDRSDLAFNPPGISLPLSELFLALPEPTP